MFDSHAHVLDEQFTSDRETILARAQAQGVRGWIEIGTSLVESKEAVAFAQSQPTLWAAVGVHPNSIASLSESDWQELERLSEQPRVVAIGEVGFDFYRGGSQAEQEPVVRRFIALAVERNLPMVFHVRDGDTSAHAVLLQLLQSLSMSERPRGVIHTYSGTWTQAQAYLDLGLYVSFSGVVTFKNAGEVSTVAVQAPLDRILIETDCPYLAPVPHRGTRNEPAYVRFVAEHMAKLRGISLLDFQEQVNANTQTLFNISF